MVSFVFFKVAGQTLALPAAAVVKVLRMAAPAPTPGAPAHLRGVLNVRGRLVPVVEGRARLGAPSRPPRPEDRLLLLSDGHREVALEVDEVLEIRELPAESVEGGSRLAPSPLVAGALRVEDGAVVISSLDAWLGDAGLEGAPA